MTALHGFAQRHPTTGLWLWIASLQYFVVQIIVAGRYVGHFSLAQNTISDLGNSVCGPYADRLVCSPSHSLMNASFIVLGIGMATGAVLNYYTLAHRHRLVAAGFGCLALAGLGTVLVGLAPENTIGELHLIGAALPLLVGNIGLLLLSRSLSVSASFRTYTFISGAVALIALSLFLTQFDMLLGSGGLERLAAYPQTIWLIAYGTYMLRRQHEK